MQQNAIVWVTYVVVATKLANRPRRVLPVRDVSVRRSLRLLNADAS